MAICLLLGRVEGDVSHPRATLIHSTIPLKNSPQLIDEVSTGGRDGALAGRVTVRRNSNYGRSLSMAMFPTQQ